jgi:GT2 family glycosyltransferase
MTRHSAQRITADVDRVDCAVVVVTYDSERDVARLLDSLPAAAAGLSVRTIVVDNGSADGTVALVRDRGDATVVESGANLGYAGGINVGRRFTGACDAVLLVNPDLVLEPGAIAELWTTLSKPAVGAAVPMLVGLDGHREDTLRREPSVPRALGDALLGRRLPRRPGWLSETVRGERAYARPHPVAWAGGAAIMVSAACDEAVGDWDERFFLYSEEVDYAARVRAAGLRIQYVPTARARHREGGSGSTAQLVALQAVNRIRYVEARGGRARAFRAAVALHELLRSRDAGHRLALRTVLRRSRWTALPSAGHVPRGRPAPPVTAEPWEVGV